MFMITGISNTGSTVEQLFKTFEEAKRIAVELESNNDMIVVISYMSKIKTLDDYKNLINEKLKDYLESDEISSIDDEIMYRKGTH